MLATQHTRALDPEAVIQKRELYAILNRRIATLKPRHQEVLRARFGLGCPEMSLEKTGEILGISGPRVRQIERKALCELRNPRNSNPLREAGGDYL
ncbi:MAG: sigma factor-like helix-turn-helix DNA-binding protein [Minisyncoccota bacterium]